jgi:hypothetical protein
MPSEFLSDIDVGLLEYDSFANNYDNESGDNSGEDGERPRREYLIDF